MRPIFLSLCCLLLCSCGPDLLVRIDKPLTLEEAQRRAFTDFPFPSSAHDIYFAIYGDWQAYECLIRFDAPPADCEATVSRALAWHQATMHSIKTYTPSSFAGPIATSDLLHPVTWFDGASITRGIYAGEESSHTLNIWIDLDTGRFYFRSTD